MGSHNNEGDERCAALQAVIKLCESLQVDASCGYDDDEQSIMVYGNVKYDLARSLGIMGWDDIERGKS